MMRRRTKCLFTPRPDLRGVRSRGRAIKRPEQLLQISVAEHLDIIRTPAWVWWHVPNGGGRSKAEGGIFKAMGVKAGNPDIHIVFERCLYTIELKAKRGRVSDNQDTMRDELERAGARYAVCRTVDEVLAQLKAWSIPTREVRYA
jgi:hypothetical protein